MSEGDARMAPVPAAGRHDARERARDAAGSTDRAADDSLALVMRARHGDARAFDDLVRARLDRLLRLAISITSSESDGRDVVQEACVRAWRELPRLRDPRRFDAWLSRIVVNGCRSTLRARRRSNVREISLEGDAVGEPHGREPAVGDHVARSDVIRRAFARLDPERRTILVLHHVDERSVAEIADLLGIPRGTAMWRLHAARRSLERALELEER